MYSMAVLTALYDQIRTLLEHKITEKSMHAGNFGFLEKNIQELKKNIQPY